MFDYRLSLALDEVADLEARALDPETREVLKLRREALERMLDDVQAGIPLPHDPRLTQPVRNAA